MRVSKTRSRSQDELTANRRGDVKCTLSAPLGFSFPLVCALLRSHAPERIEFCPLTPASVAAMFTNCRMEPKRSKSKRNAAENDEGYSYPRGTIAALSSYCPFLPQSSYPRHAFLPCRRWCLRDPQRSHLLAVTLRGSPSLRVVAAMPLLNLCKCVGFAGWASSKELNVGVQGRNTRCRCLFTCCKR